MIECKELAGKVIRSLTIHQNGSYGPEVSIDFEDGQNFNVTLDTRVQFTIEAKLTLDEGGQPQVLKDYTVSGDPR